MISNEILLSKACVSYVSKVVCSVLEEGGGAVEGVGAEKHKFLGPRMFD